MVISSTTTPFECTAKAVMCGNNGHVPMTDKFLMNVHAMYKKCTGNIHNSIPTLMKEVINFYVVMVTSVDKQAFKFFLELNRGNFCHSQSAMQGKKRSNFFINVSEEDMVRSIIVYFGKIRKNLCCQSMLSVSYLRLDATFIVNAV